MKYISLIMQAKEMLLLGSTEDAKKLLKDGINMAKKYKNKSFIEFYLGELQDIDGNYEIAICHKKAAVQLTKKKNTNHFFLKVWEYLSVN